MARSMSETRKEARPGGIGESDPETIRVYGPDGRLKAGGRRAPAPPPKVRERLAAAIRRRKRARAGSV